MNLQALSYVTIIYHFHQINDAMAALNNWLIWYLSCRFGIHWWWKFACKPNKGIQLGTSKITFKAHLRLHEYKAGHNSMSSFSAPRPALCKEPKNFHWNLAERGVDQYHCIDWTKIQNILTMQLQKQFHIGTVFSYFGPFCLYQGLLQFQNICLPSQSTQRYPGKPMPHALDVRIKRLAHSLSATQITINWNSPSDPLHSVDALAQRGLFCPKLFLVCFCS